MSGKMVLRRLVIALAAGVLVAGAGASWVQAADDAKTVAPAAANVTGTWTWSSAGQNGQTRVATLTLKQDGEKLTGTLGGGRGEPAEIKDGSVKNGEVAFTVTRKGNQGDVTSKYTGKLEGDTLKLKSETEVNGQTRTREIEAKRATEEKPAAK